MKKEKFIFLLGAILFLTIIISFIVHSFQISNEDLRIKSANMTSMNIIHPTTIKFFADELNFIDKRINMSFDSRFIFDLQNVSILEFNIGNESYIFNKEVKK